MLKGKIKSVTAGTFAAAFIIAAPTAVLAKADNHSNSNAHNKITICHATGSQSNPFVVITPDANGVVNGHEAHQDANDIIPPFTYNDHGSQANFAGQNWSTDNQAIFNNGCKVASTEGQTDCDNDTDNSPASECVTGGGRGGGTEVNNNVQTGQVLGAAIGGQGAAVQQTPVGGVNAGAGGGSALNLSFN